MPRALNPNLKLLNGRSEGRDSGGRTVKQTGIARDLPDKPELSPEASAEWDRLTRDLAPVLKGADRAALANLCEVWSDLVRIRKHLRRNGFNMTVKVRDAAGAVTSKRIERPEVRLLTKLLTEHRQLSAQFGATPTSEAAAAKLDTGNGAADAANPFANGAT
ncbi:P27 family phage terminase small subunit [Rhodococcus sp. 06-1477-1A]|uniref:P27 family phage terminase small subunit n=1 Tax=Rhodococcus sp. 06-1477-1A TaxID=2022497 RepID=UPI000B9BC995|nr:P27 family phage terminase small subunit [Rhodococcus sp. 06-1477-1A]OZD43518.1 hypothetical protein CH264_17725 [Rhodococcus sp. 06-1477-1A]